jgi:nitrite reductase/ring-hydroxylating ferredoxin subunit
MRCFRTCPEQAGRKYESHSFLFLDRSLIVVVFSPQFATSLSMAKFKSALKYVPCIPLADLPKPGGATSGVAGGLAICIAVDKSGSVYALGDKCPPVNQPLSFGKVIGDTIQDPVLGSTFSLKTGDVVNWCPSGIGKLIGGAFSPTGVPTYPVRQRGGAIEVQVDVNAKFNFEANFWSGMLDAQG